LPPVGNSVHSSGVFDPAARPEVFICEISGSACGIEVAHMTMSPASGDEMIVLDISNERYLVNWHSWRIPNYSPSKTRAYRIRVYTEGNLLGYADVWVGPSLPTIPIKFRLDEHAPPPPPAVDFTTEMVVALFLGERPTGGYEIEVTQVERTDRGLAVRFRVKKPDAGAMLMQVLTQPFHLIELPRVDESLTFIAENPSR